MMSFRKRSVRPNLNASKRQIPPISEKNELPKNISIEEKPIQENEILSDPAVVSTDSVPLEENVLDEGMNKKGESSSSPNVGKRLSKRTKIAPKLTQKKTPAISTVGISSSCNQSIPISPLAITYDNLDKGVKPILPESNPIKDISTICGISEKVNEPDNCQEVTNDILMDNGEGERTMDVLSVYKIITSKNKDKNGSPVKSMIEHEGKNDTNIPTDTSIAILNKEKRIPKRTKVMPKLTPRCKLQVKLKDLRENDEAASEDTPVEKSLNEPKISKDNSINNRGNSNEQEDAAIDSHEIDNIMLKESAIVTCIDDKKKDSTSIKTSRLQKRVKVRPKLTLRTNDRSATCGKDLLDCKDILKNENSNLGESRTMTGIIDLEGRTNIESRSSLSKTLDKEEIIDSDIGGNRTNVQCLDGEYENDNSTNNQAVHEDNEAVSSSDVLVSNNLDNTVHLTSDKKELRHVRFTYGDNDEVESIDNLEDSSNQHLTETGKHMSTDNVDVDDESSIKSPVPSENRNLRYDSNDEYDSLSEGEILGKQLISKNKVFKPNLGTKRRERLASFSAYSSCDEDDWQNQKKRKKKDKKTPGENNEIDKKKQDEKKTKPKKPTKQRKNSENVEPNVEKVPKKRKRKAKSGKGKQQEERDLSTLTMQELIHYNHPSFKTVELRSKREEDENERVMELGSVNSSAPTEKKPDADLKPDSNEVMAPQLMINEDGEIVINQESLTISQKVDDSSLKNSAVVYEDSLSYGTHLKKKHNVGKRWKIEETLRFYKALSEIGTDFTLMSQAFGRFTRNELKKKFKKEEKVNCDLVDRALSNRLPLNMEMFLRGKEEMKERADENDNNVSKVPQAEAESSNGGVCLENGAE